MVLRKSKKELNMYKYNRLERDEGVLLSRSNANIAETIARSVEKKEQLDTDISGLSFHR